MGEGYPSPSYISPTNNLKTLGLSLKFMLPAPNPVCSIFMRGRLPNSDESSLTNAAPVGVVNSKLVSVAYTGTPLRISAEAGDGTGKIPCSVFTEPLPIFTGDEQTFFTPRISNPIMVPKTSTMQSTAPNS